MGKTGSLGTNFAFDTDFALPFDTAADLVAFTDGVSLGTRAIALDSNTLYAWDGVQWNPEVYGKKQASFSISATSAQATLAQIVVPADSLGTKGSLVTFVSGAITQNTGASRAIGLSASFGGTNMWGDTSGTIVTNSANRHPFFWRMILTSENSVTSHRLTGHVVIGSPTLGTAAGEGAFSTADNANFGMHGTSIVNTHTLDRTFLLSVALGTASVSYSIVGNAVFFVIPGYS